MEYPKFKVCARCFTFNQSKYITDTMNGFTMQKTDFPFVCCIVDDASTDGEQDVIMDYLEANFDLSEGSVYYQKETDYANITYAQHKTNTNCYFAVLLLKKNHYSQRKPKMQYLAEWTDSVEYEALCEGDDYWIDEYKLAKQAELMDGNPELGMCYTRYYKFDNQNRAVGGSYTEFKKLLFANVIGTLTVMLRRCVYDNYERDIQPFDKGWKMGDYPMWLYLAAESTIRFINEPTAVYRVLSESASHSVSLDKQLAFVESAYAIQRYFNLRYNLGYSKKLARDYQRARLCTISQKGSVLVFCKAFVAGVRDDWYNIFSWKTYGYLMRMITYRLQREQ